MSRASRRDNSTSASLFPFLAVLLCTMGVLVVLLVVMASVQLHQAEEKQLAEQTAAPQVDEAEQELLRAEMAKLDEAAQQLRARRGELTQHLRDEEQRLSQIEENIRRRQERLALLRVEIEELKALDQGNVDDLEQAKERLAKQQELIAQTEKEIEALKAEAEKHDKHYAIVPYEGPHGTRRQPLYIECKQDRVVLQPEGIELTAEDFNEALMAGGPLPSAIRAAQRYYIDHGLSDQKQAYPLVIGRPDASGSLARVLATLSDLNMEYGYEVVDADWQLDYTAADPALASEIERAVRHARLRLEDLKLQAPGTFARNGIDTFELGPSLLQRVRQGSLPPNYSPIGGRSAGGSNSMVMLSGEAISVDRLAAALEAGSPQAGNRTRGTGGGRGTGGQIAYQGLDTEEPSATQSRSAAAPMDRYAAADRARQQAANADTADGQPGGEQLDGSQQPGSPQQAGGPQQAMSQPAASPAGKESQAQTNAQMAQANGADGSATGSGQQPSQQGSAAQAGNMLTPTAPQASAMSGEATSQQAASQSKQQLNGMALVRTIRVSVAANQLVVRSGKQTVADRSIPLDGDHRQAAGKFIKAIRSEIEGWGIAGQGLYWQPVLEMSVTPGGEQLANQLATALRQGGVEVRVASLR